MKKSPSSAPGFDLSLLNIREADLVSKKLLMLIEGQTSLGPKKAAEKYGYSQQRYFQLLKAFKAKGHQALINHKPGPKQKSVLTEPAEQLIVRYKFLDEYQSAEVIAGRLKQAGYKMSASSVQRTLEKYGLQKKNL